MQIFVLSSSRIQQRGYDTLFNYTTGNPKSGVAKLVKKAPLKAQVAQCALAVTSHWHAMHDFCYAMTICVLSCDHTTHVPDTAIGNLRFTEAWQDTAVPFRRMTAFYKL